MKQQLELFDVLTLVPEKKRPSLPPLKMYEYFLLISPVSEVKQRVRELRYKLHKHVGLSLENLISVPHLSLVLFRQRDEMDSNVLDKTISAISGFRPFSISTDKAGVFNHPSNKDVVLKVENPDMVRALMDSLSDEFRFSANRYAPHITIGKSIANKNFEKVSPSLNEFDCKTTFMCNSVTILRRTVEISERMTRKSRYEKVAEVPLRG
jgi:2'-5' RNA ligase